MSDSDANISQIEALFLQLQEPDSPDLNPPDWYVPDPILATCLIWRVCVEVKLVC